MVTMVVTTVLATTMFKPVTMATVATMLKKVMMKTRRQWW
jgi:hypothetical protein